MLVLKLSGVYATAAMKRLMAGEVVKSAVSVTRVPPATGSSS